MKTEPSLRGLLWLDWLRAQRIWADMREYEFHTPESVFLIQRGQLVPALGWTLLQANERRRA